MCMFDKIPFSKKGDFNWLHLKTDVTGPILDIFEIID